MKRFQFIGAIFSWGGVVKAKCCYKKMFFTQRFFFGVNTQTMAYNKKPRTRYSAEYHGSSYNNYSDFGSDESCNNNEYYDNVGDEFLNNEQRFSPDWPAPMLAPVKPRATPMTEFPLSCSINYKSGTIRCVNNESRGGLNSQNTYGNPLMVLPSRQPGLGGPASAGLGGPASAPEVLVYNVDFNQRGHNVTPTRRFVQAPPTDNFNYVRGVAVVREQPDSPLNRILTRQPIGPWQLVGAAVTEFPTDTSSKDRTMLVYAQTVDGARNRYNYRVVDSNSVPLNVGHKVQWKDEHSHLHIPGYPSKYKLHLYDTFRM